MKALSDISEDDIESLARRSRALIELTSNENLNDDYVVGFIHGMRRALLLRGEFVPDVDLE